MTSYAISPASSWENGSPRKVSTGSLVSISEQELGDCPNQRNRDAGYYEWHASTQSEAAEAVRVVTISPPVGGEMGTAGMAAFERPLCEFQDSATHASATSEPHVLWSSRRGRFAFYLGTGSTGELIIGDVDSVHYAGEIRYLPVLNRVPS